MKSLSIKIEPELKKEAQKMADEVGISLSGLVKMLLKNAVRTGKLDIATKPKYHGGPEEGDIVFEDPKKAIKYFEELAKNDGNMA